MRKTYVVDTSALINDPGLILRLGDHNIVVPITVVEELDRKKRDPNGVGQSAREASRQLYSCIQHGSLKHGAKLPTGGELTISYECANWTELPIGLEKSNDNRILLIAKKKQKQGDKVFLVSQDINLQLKAEACGFGTEHQLDRQKRNGPKDRLRAIEVQNSDLRKSFSENGFLRFDRINALHYDGLFENQCCRLHFGDQDCLAICKKSQNKFDFVPRPKKRQHKSLHPRNDEQILAMALLNDPSIGIVALSGIAGSGKTLLALLVGYLYVQQDIYDQMIIYRPAHDVDKSLGYLPGDLGEKYEPWKRPIMDNLELILSCEAQSEKKSAGRERGTVHSTNNEHSVGFLISHGTIDISPISYVRGRSLIKKWVIGDESQNWSRHVVKTLLTRKGQGTKMIITGDPEQIDNPYLDIHSNGLSVAIESLKGEKAFGHIIMPKSERSDDAEMVATRM